MRSTLIRRYVALLAKRKRKPSESYTDPGQHNGCAHVYPVILAPTYALWDYFKLRRVRAAGIRLGGVTSGYIASIYDSAMATSENYQVPWWAAILHSFPHLDLTFRTTESTFQPKDQRYLEVSIDPPTIA